MDTQNQYEIEASVRTNRDDVGESGFTIHIRDEAAAMQLFKLVATLSGKNKEDITKPPTDNSPWYLTGYLKPKQLTKQELESIKAVKIVEE